MIAIQKTVTIPGNRRLSIDLPESFPVGTATIWCALVDTEEQPPARALPFDTREDARKAMPFYPDFWDWILHPLQSYRRTSWKKLMTDIHAHNEKHGPLFGGIDGIEYQRIVRSEWEGRI